MGVTLHYYLAHDKNFVKPSLDSVQGLAKNIQEGPAKTLDIPVVIDRISDAHLRIDIGGCESLVFKFGEFKDLPDFIKSKAGDPDAWFPFNSKFLRDGMFICWGFCKTQYADKLAEHRFVADIISHLAGKCTLAYVSDEGDYYHSGRIEDAALAIGETAKVIDSIGGMLQNAGWSGDHILKGGDTKIKPIRKKK